MAIQCLRKNCVLEFTIDFDNLTGPELFALCYSLRPKEGFHHKIGMAKPLGLGSIALEVLEVCKIDRLSRYSAAGFGLPRFSMIAAPGNGWVADKAITWKAVLAKKAPNIGNSLTVFETIGTTRVAAMQYPMTRVQANKEQELFNWPSENRRVGKDLTQFLRPVTDSGDLYPLPWNCYLLAISAGQVPTGSGIEQLYAQTTGHFEAANVDAANGWIANDGNYSRGSVIYVVGNEAQLEDIDPGKADVRKVRINNIAGPPPPRYGRRTSDQKTLESLQKALNLRAV